MNPQEHLHVCRVCGAEPRAVHHGPLDRGDWVIDCPSGCFPIPFCSNRFSRAADLWNYNQRVNVARFMEPGETPPLISPLTPNKFPGGL